MNLLCYYIIFGENTISHRDLESFKIKMELMDESNNIEIIKNKMLINNFNCDINDLQIFLQKENIKNNIFLSSLSSTWYKCPNNHYYINEEKNYKICKYCIDSENERKTFSIKEKQKHKSILSISDDNSNSDNDSDSDSDSDSDKENSNSDNSNGSNNDNSQNDFFNKESNNIKDNDFEDFFM